MQFLCWKNRISSQPCKREGEIQNQIRLEQANYRKYQEWIESLSIRRKGSDLRVFHLGSRCCCCYKGSESTLETRTKLENFKRWYQFWLMQSSWWRNGTVKSHGRKNIQK